MTAWTKLLLSSILVAALSGAPGLAAAGPYDGSRAFLCAVPTIIECSASGQCERHSTTDGNAPTFIKVDVAGQMVTDGPTKKSPVKSAIRQDGELIVQGGENGRGWNLTINEETGRMAGALVDDDYTFSLFGVCTIP